MIDYAKLALKYAYLALKKRKQIIYNKLKAKAMHLDNFTSAVRITTRIDVQCAPWPGVGHPLLAAIKPVRSGHGNAACHPLG